MQLPATSLEWLMVISFGIIGSVVLMSFTEFFIHRYLMHRRVLPQFVYNLFPMLEQLFRAHVFEHHHHFYKQFNYEPDPYGRNINIKIAHIHTVIAIVGYAPFLLLFAWLVSPIPPLIFAGIILLHRVLWNIIHKEMHQPQHPHWTYNELYMSLARHHYLHHKNNDRNFNIVIPFADYLLGRNIHATKEQVTEMKRMGYLK
ncbi:MAG TPA: hypothetical protein VJB70_04045 [Candidatus Paceibacterota bacterium]